MSHNQTIVRLEWAPEFMDAGKTEERSKALDAEVEKLSQWLAKLPDSRAAGALNNSERALVKTYLVQKLSGRLDGDV